jgi:DNA-binding SARP family transcriptional activator
MDCPTDPDPQRAGASLAQTLSRLLRAAGSESLERLPRGAVRLQCNSRVDIESAQATADEAEGLKRGRLPARAAPPEA